MNRDLDVDQTAVLKAINPFPRQARVLFLSGERGPQARLVIYRNEVANTHLEELVAVVSVRFNRGVVDFHELERAHLAHEHGPRVIRKEQTEARCRVAERLFGGFPLRDIGAYADGAPTPIPRRFDVDILREPAYTAVAQPAPEFLSIVASGARLLVAETLDGLALLGQDALKPGVGK